MSNNKQEQSKPTKGRQKRRRKGRCLEDRPILEKNAAGIDLGAREMFVAVPQTGMSIRSRFSVRGRAPDRDVDPVQIFDSFTEDLQRLVACGVTTVAMASTGASGIPLYDILEARGLKPCLGERRYRKNVPGRHTERHECISGCHTYHWVGLLRGAFRPEADLCAVRVLVRHRAEWVQSASHHVQHMHQVLTPMNLQIHHVISDITGLTGLAIVDAFLDGQRVRGRIGKAAGSTGPSRRRNHSPIPAGATGNLHLSTLRQSRELYRTTRSRCDREIEQLLGDLAPRADPSQKPNRQTASAYRSDQKRREKANVGTGFDLRTKADKLFGVDVTQIPGVEAIALPLLSKIGRDLSQWPTAAQFASWLGLLIRRQVEYDETIWATRNAGRKRRLEQHLKRQAERMGCRLVPVADMGAL
jgi:hypothetical protein